MPIIRIDHETFGKLFVDPEENDSIPGQYRLASEILSKYVFDPRNVMKLTSNSNGFGKGLIEYSEEERRRLARELHDDISQRLALLADDADYLRRKIVRVNEANRQRLEHLAKNARSLSEDIRRISQILHPGIVEDLGLVAALRSLATDFAERSGLPTIFVESNLPPSVPREISTAAYRIVQESLSNIWRHAGETSVRVTLEGHQEEIALVIADNGVGFDAEKCTGLGLTSMRERADFAGGNLTLKTAPGQGTTIHVRLPIRQSPALD